MFCVPKNGSYNFKSSKPRWVFVGAFKNVKKFHATMCMRNLANMWIMYIFNIFFWHSQENGAAPKKEVFRELERGKKGIKTTVGQQELNEVKEWSQNCIGWLVLEMLKLIMLSRKCICGTMTVRPQPQKKNSYCAESPSKISRNGTKGYEVREEGQYKLGKCCDDHGRIHKNG